MPHNPPIATVRDRLFDAYGSITTRRVYARGAGAAAFEVETVREFYNRDGGREDYEFSTEVFASRSAALAAAGVGPEAQAVAA